MTNPPLPEEIIAKINEDADAYAGVKIWIDQRPTARIPDKEDLALFDYIAETSYIAGAADGYSLALALKDALERISSLSDEYPIQVAIDIADAALKLFPEQGKEGKENG